MNQMRFNQQAACAVVRKRSAGTALRFCDPVEMQHWRGGVLLGIHKTMNDIVNQGKNTIFDTYFNNLAQIANNSWFIGLISNTGYTGLAATDIMSSHSGWTEFTSYSQTTRVPWGSVPSNAQTVTNTTPCQFDIVAPGGTVIGVFTVTQGTKGGTTGILWATALFAANVPVNAGDQLKITYSVSA